MTRPKHLESNNPPGPTFQVRLLGGLTLAWDGAALPEIPSRTARSLFTYLVTYRDQPHTRHLLAGTFWPDLPDNVARRRLSRALWQIRHSLQNEDHPQPVLLTEGDNIQLNPNLSLWLDVEEFSQSVDWAIGKPTDRLPNLQKLSRVVELYRGEFLVGYYDDWLLRERERLLEMFLAMLERLVEGYKRRGEYERALAHARRLAGEAPWREKAHREVMRLCHLLGRDNEALKQFEVCRQTLAEELDTEPSPETVALVRDLAKRSGQGSVPDLPEASPSSAAIVLDSAQTVELPLVGREQERAELLAHVEALFQGLGGMALVEGEAGVGKTRLLQTVARDAEWRGAEVLWGEAQEIESSVPYGPLVEALAEGLSPLRANQLEQLVDRIWLQVLSPLLPPLVTWLPDLTPAPQLDPTQERDRLVAALARFLGGWGQIKPLVVVLENLHWIGEDTLDVLARLAPSLKERGVLLIGSYRGEDARALPGIWQKLRTLDRAGAQHRLVLGGLGAEATGELVRRSLGMGTSVPLFETRLYRETQGNPLFVLETLRALYGEGLLVWDADGQWSTPWDKTTSDYAELPLPQAVEQTIARRLAFLSPALQQMMHLTAVLGERFDFDLLLVASDEESPSVLAALGELVQRRFLDETARDYRFSHDKVRQVTYDGIDAQERSLLHRQVACALEALQPDRVTALAHHWTGGGVWDKAADYHQQAGDRAQAVYANADATAHYTQALGALERLAEPAEPAQVFELRLAREAVYGLQSERKAQADELAALEALAETLDDQGQQAKVALRQAEYATKTGDYPAAIAAAQATIQLSHTAGDVQREAAGHFQWGEALRLQSNYEAARAQFEHSLAWAQSTAIHQLEASSLRGLGNICERLGDYIGAKAYQEQSLHICSAIGDRWGESKTLNNLGNVCNGQGDVVGARAYFEQALSIERELGDRYVESGTLLNLGLAIWSLGDYVGAGGYFEQSLAIARDIGDPFIESAALSNLTRISHYLGNDQVAREYGRQCLSIAREIGSSFLAGYGLTYLGHALAGLGRLAEAADTYHEAIALRRELGQLNLAMESLAGLVRVHLAQGDTLQAQAQVNEILAHLESDGLDGMVEPFQVYLTCYHVLEANDDGRTPEVLATAHKLLQEQAAKISDEGTRCLFLENVAAHREIIATYRELQAPRQGRQTCPERSRRVQVRLPRADAPTGRPLRDDEYTTITWTVDAPGDAEIPHKQARRRHRILRLLDQARAQSAVPRDRDLAAALGVSLSTLRRDLVTLRAKGHDLLTRGRKTPNAIGGDQQVV